MIVSFFQYAFGVFLFTFLTGFLLQGRSFLPDKNRREHADCRYMESPRKVDISSENAKNNERINFTVANHCQYGTFIGLYPQRNIMLSLSALEERGEISTVYSRKGILVCISRLFWEMCLHHQRDVSRFEIKQKECSAQLQKCINKERIFLPQIHYLTILKATSVH